MSVCCQFCEHNADKFCGCPPCSWIREQWTEEQMAEAGHVTYAMRRKDLLASIAEGRREGRL